MHQSILVDITIVFITALIGGNLAQFLRQSPLIGYIIGGIIAGPHVLRWVTNTSSINDMAEIGVILLMFTLGIEFSISRLANVKKIAILGSILQIGLQVLITISLAHLMQVTVYQALFIGCVVSISSTMIVLRVLSEQGHLNSIQGQIMLGMLIVQDLAVVVMVSLLPRLGHLTGINWRSFLTTTLAALGLVLFTVYLAQKVVPRIMNKAVRTNNSDLFLVLALSLGMGVATLFHYLGASFSLGAFIAGLLVSDSDYAHELLGKIASLRDAFVILFFVSAGMLIDPTALFADFRLLFILLILIMPVKFLLFYLITRVFKYHKRIAFYVGMGMMQTGEFSFVMARIGLDNGIFDPVIYNVILASTLITILAAPSFMRWSPIWYNQLTKTSKRQRSRIVDQEQTKDPVMTDHVLLCGFGRVGKEIGTALRAMAVPFMVVEYDFRAVMELKELQIPYVYGDASNLSVLRQVSVGKAKLAVLTLPDALVNERAIRKLLKLNPDIKIIARAHSGWEKQILLDAGAFEVVQPEQEAGVQMARHMIINLDLPEDDVIKYLENYYIKDYHQLFSSFAIDYIKEDPLAIRAYEVPSYSGLIDTRLADSKIRETTGCAVVTIRRANGEVIINPHSYEFIRA
ncbi:MAG: cation:proton antiporter, partial [Methylocystaceae bacterium]